jgi:hypothetical protein
MWYVILTGAQTTAIARATASTSSKKDAASAAWSSKGSTT